MIVDDCLERDRRKAWARYFRQREETQQVAWWAAELGEWLAQTGGTLHPAAHELIGLVRSALPADGELEVRRYVKRLRADEEKTP